MDLDLVLERCLLSVDLDLDFCRLAGDLVLDPRFLTTDTDLRRFLIDFDHQILIGVLEYRSVLDLDRLLLPGDLELDRRL